MLNVGGMDVGHIARAITDLVLEHSLVVLFVGGAAAWADMRFLCADQLRPSEAPPIKVSLTEIQIRGRSSRSTR